MSNVFFSWVRSTGFCSIVGRLPRIRFFSAWVQICFDAGATAQLSTGAFRRYAISAAEPARKPGAFSAGARLGLHDGRLRMTYLSSYREQHEHYVYGVPLTPDHAMPNLYLSSRSGELAGAAFCDRRGGPLQAQFGLYYFREALYDNWSISDFPRILNFGWPRVGQQSAGQPVLGRVCSGDLRCGRPCGSRCVCANAMMKKEYFSQSMRNLSPVPEPATNFVDAELRHDQSSKLTGRAGVRVRRGRAHHALRDGLDRIQGGRRQFRLPGGHQSQPRSNAAEPSLCRHPYSSMSRRPLRRTKQESNRDSRTSSST